MTNTRYAEPYALAVTRYRLLAFLLAFALFLCHGAFGASHQVSLCDACGLAETPDVHHSAMQQTAPAGDHAGDDPGEGLVGHSGYFAVALALFGAAVFKLLLDAARKPVRVAASPASRPRYSPSVSFLPRGPTLLLLQVFRL